MQKVKDRVTSCSDGEAKERWWVALVAGTPGLHEDVAMCLGEAPVYRILDPI